ncbi:hypothetical protein EK21DRAFT_70098 [Setomelanomma holmii]|uniref:Pentatricopeptide repeat domain-containing protein n=1 Tax=Setomelanomma holmii TaxID=210430 RepID=A0A9P4LLQ6_9PLEO|nr:hypothetical protein EK21DRAFT_70098 [Setomelanomma holmii]
MPPALERLLARPPALRLLRVIVNCSDLPAACSTTTPCNHDATRRSYATSPQDRPRQKWKRWREGTNQIGRDAQLPQLLEVEVASNALLDDLEAVAGADSSAAKWAQSLALRERHHGLRGIKAIWELRLCSCYALPTRSSADADYLWGTFVTHRELVPQVIQYAAEALEQTGHLYPGLYAVTMKYWLPRDPTMALAYHDTMVEKLKLKQLPLKMLAKYGRSTFKPAAYEALLDIYRFSDECNLYDHVVPALIKKGAISLARRWHDLCVSHDDMPSESVANVPVVQILLAASTTDSTNRLVHQKPTRESRKYDQDLLRRLKGRDTAPVRFEDSFCARMFATRTFPPESVIKGLALVGVNEIGPQAVLAMASRTEPLEDLPRIFEELRAAGIALQGCVFSLAVEKFAKEQNWTLVGSMLDSDQHPDVFGDSEVQRKLLKFYMEQDDRTQIQRTLAILTLFHKDSIEESWNLLLQAHIRSTGPQHVAEVLQDMRSRGIMVTIESVAAIKGLLRRRQRGKKPVTKGADFDDLRFVTRIFMVILQFGMGPVSPLTWREIIRRFGMTGRFRELRRLLLWLLCWYTPRNSACFTKLPSSPFREPALAKLREAYPERNHYFHFPATVTQHEIKLHPLRQLFPPSFQQALVVWGFRAGLLPNARWEQSLVGPPLEKKHYRQRLLQRKILQQSKWSAGLRTLVLLRDLGLYVHRHTVVKTLQMQFTILFGRGRSGVIENRVMEKSNVLPYATYVREVNDIWGSQLFREPERFLQGMIHDHIWHPRLRRRIDRGASLSLNEILGPDWKHRQQENSKENGKTGATTAGDRALGELERAFAAEKLSVDPGFEWMYEASLDTTGAQVPGGDARANSEKVVVGK